MLDSLIADVIYSARRFARSPVVSAVIVATVALVLAANTTAFGLMNAVTLRPVVAADPGRLISLSLTDTDSGRPGYFYAAPFLSLRSQQTSFALMTMYSSGVYRVEARTQTIDVGAEGVGEDYFQILGPAIAAGRVLDPVDFQNSSDSPGAVISYRLLQRLFGGDTRAVGETMKVDGRPVVIVGVTAAPFSGLQLDSGSDVFMPLPFARQLAGDANGPLRALTVIGLRAQDVAFERARAEVTAMWPAIQQATSSPNVPTNPALSSPQIIVEPLANGFSTVRRQWSNAFSVVLGLTSILLTIGCMNLMGLMLALSMSRRQEVALRMALGASRSRLIRQQLIEGLILASCGLGLALPIAWWSGEFITQTLTVARTIPLQRSMIPDGRVIVAAAGMAAGMGLLIGLLPAWRLAKKGSVDPSAQTRGLARALGRSGRIVLSAQVAASLILFVSAGLLGETLLHLRANHAELDSARIVFTRLARNPGDRGQLEWPYFQKLIDELSAAPGIDSVAMSSFFPAYSGFVGNVPLEQFQTAPVSSLVAAAMVEFVTPGFFEIYGLRQLSGRDFRWLDSEKSPDVAILSRGFAEKLFPAGNAVGQRIFTGVGSATKSLEVVGVVGDAPMGTLRQANLPVVFRPMMQGRSQSPMTHAKVSGDMAMAREAYTRIVQAQSHHFVRGLFTIDDWFDNALLQERLMAGVSRFASTMAALLACLGIYGLLSYSVSARVREIGVRVALGATSRNIGGMILKETLTIVAPGLLVGLPCAVGAAGLIRSQLYGVEPADPLIMIGAAIAFMAIGLVASLLPAVRASRIDPIAALRRD